MNSFSIKHLNPCRDGLKYYNSFASLTDFWQNCNRGDWMLWLAAKLNVKEDLLRLTACKCAETVMHLMRDQRSKTAILRCINSGGVYNSYAYRTAAAAAAAAAADYATAHYTAAADNAAYAAAHYTAAADNAAYAAAAADAAADAAKNKNRMQTADICRKYLTKEVTKCQLNQ